MPGTERLCIFDTTLRDGEQSPGVTLTVQEKIDIARQLSRLGVDVCEAGFPIASEGDFEAVKQISLQVGPLLIGRKVPMVICALARAVPRDLERAWEAIKDAPLKRIHTFLATSDVHLEFKLKISRAECIEKATAAVALAKSLGCTDIEFSPEDAGRSDKDFLVTVLESVVEAGATTLNIPDTVGYNTPEEYGALIKYLVDNVKSTKPIIFSTHCHNDLGLATANTLAGIQNGARQVEVTINGIGERAVTKKTGMMIQANKSIVGSNAFAHESGIHQDGYLKNKSTYEIISPAVVGIPAKALVLGKHSGRNALYSRIDEIVKNTMYADHLQASPDLYKNLFVAFKALADNCKTGVTDEDLFALLDEQLNITAGQPWVFESLELQSSANASTATVVILDSTLEKRSETAFGQGPVSAIFNAIQGIVGNHHTVASFDVQAISSGSESLGKSTVKLTTGAESGLTYQGQGTDSNVLIASAKAYVNAVNKVESARTLLRSSSGTRKVDI